MRNLAYRLMACAKATSAACRGAYRLRPRNLAPASTWYCTDPPRIATSRRWTTTSMSHHLFLLSPSDTPLYELTHYSSKPIQTTTSPLASNLPSWSTSAFAGTLTALSGASSVNQTYHVQSGGVRMGGGKDRHVIQMVANASLDVIEDVMRKENLM